jgi:hypothetical protein
MAEVAAVVVASVAVASVVAVEGALTMTTLVLVQVRLDWSVATY